MEKSEEENKPAVKKKVNIVILFWIVLFVGLIAVKLLFL